MEHVNKLKAAVAAMGAALTALWGWFGWMVVVWIVCMALDYITGTAAAVKSGEWSSKIAREGILHKGGCVAVALVAGLMDLGIGVILDNVAGTELPFDYGVLLCPVVLVWYILTEAGSIVENAGAMGAPVPGWLRKAIAAFRTKVDSARGDGPEVTE